MISDNADIIKHSAIASGAKEIFTNTFIRELQGLTIQGCQRVVHQAVLTGCEAPLRLQLALGRYPLLRSYFSLAGLPPGSFHLKHYSGMLQGIFEPAAERKRGSLDRIMADFPGRRFVPVGDSGEADLEAYTDIVMANPGRVLAVYIRDVTTPDKKFFDQAISNVGPDAMTRSNGSRDHYSHSSASDDPEARPSLPEQRNALSESGHESTPLPEHLNNFEDEPDDLSTEISYHPDLLELQEGDRSAPKPSPPPSTGEAC